MPKQKDKKGVKPPLSSAFASKQEYSRLMEKYWIPPEKPLNFAEVNPDVTSRHRKRDAEETRDWNFRFENPGQIIVTKTGKVYIVALVPELPDESGAIAGFRPMPGKQGEIGKLFAQPSCIYGPYSLKNLIMDTGSITLHGATPFDVKNVKIRQRIGPIRRNAALDFRSDDISALFEDPHIRWRVVQAIKRRDYEALIELDKEAAETALKKLNDSK